MFRPSLAATICLLIASSAWWQDGLHFATGIKIGEVTSDSAIIWARLTSRDRPVPDDGSQPLPKEAPDTAVDTLPGAVPGAVGDVQLLVSTNPDLSQAKEHPAARVTAGTDFSHQWRIKNLEPATKYFVRVLAFDATGQRRNHFDGSFTTAPKPDEWQDVRFAAAGCQAYHDRDDPAGFRIYGAMAKMQLDFAAITGDDVYYDSDPPTADTVEMARYHWGRHVQPAAAGRVSPPRSQLLREGRPRHGEER